MSPARRRALGALAVVLVLGLALLAWRPGVVLEAEFARQRLAASAQVQAVQAAGHRWSVLAAGPEAAPLVVLVHGFTGSKENWLPLMAELRHGHRVLAPDLPGWNASQRIDGEDYGVVAQSMRLEAWLDADGRQPAMLVGHSMGGHIVGLLAARRPDLAPRVVLMSSAGVEFQANEFGRAVLDGDNPFAVHSRADLHRQLELVFEDPPFLPWPADRALAQRRAAAADFESEVLERIGRGAEAYALQPLLPSIRQPVLLLWCRNDRVIDVSAADIMAEALPDARKRVLEGCGHMPLMESPDAVARALRAFLGE
ncbi:MAG: alpha/beta fold hydrolase [Lysobacteraceae bacterium]